MTSLSPDRTVIVTGANGGLGRVLRSLLTEHGWSVVASDIAGSDVVIADAGTAEGAVTMVDAALSANGRIDGLVLNAGVQFMAPIEEFPLADWERLLGVMLTGPFLTLKAAWPHLLASQGSVVVIGSTSSLLAEKYKTAYTSAKHGVLGLVRTAALEGAPHGVRVNAVLPGGMLTPLLESQMGQQMQLHGRTREEVLQAWCARHMIPRPVEPREVAETVSFLLSPASSGITAAAIPVDLGVTSW